MEIVETSQRGRTRFKYHGQQKAWSFSYDLWGRKVTEYVTSVMDMEPANLLALCDESRQMAKIIAKRAAKGLSSSSTTSAPAQPVKALGRRALLKEGRPALLKEGRPALLNKGPSALLAEGRPVPLAEGRPAPLEEDRPAPLEEGHPARA